MLRHYKYPLKVWLTSALLGTVLFFLYNQVVKTTSYPMNSAEIMLVTLILSTLFSIPCWLLLWVVHTYASDNIKKPLHIKLLTVFVAQIMLIGLMDLLGILVEEQILVPFSLSLLISTVVFSVKSDIATSEQTSSKI